MPLYYDSGAIEVDWLREQIKEENYTVSINLPKISPIKIKSQIYTESCVQSTESDVLE